MASRPKVIQPDAGPSRPTPAATPTTTPTTLRPKASMSSLARARVTVPRRAASPTKSSPGASVYATPPSLQPVRKGTRPASAMGHARSLTQSPTSAGAAPYGPLLESAETPEQRRRYMASMPSSPTSALSPTSTPAARERRSSINSATGTVRVKAKVTAVVKPPPLPSPPLATPTRPTLDARSPSMYSVRAAPTAPVPMPTFQTLPPTPVKDPPPAQPTIAQTLSYSPPTSVLSSRSSFSVTSSQSHMRSLSGTSLEAGDEDRSTPVPVYAKVNGGPRSPVSPVAMATAMPLNEEALDEDGDEDTALNAYGNRRDSIVGETRAEARSNRKIADLEITNASLLALNTSLEKTRHDQAKEIRDLRRRLRETRLILPPRAYAAHKHEWEDDVPSDDDGEEEEDGEGEGGEGGEDPAWERVKGLVDEILERGRRALEDEVEIPMERGGGARKVLSAEEVEDLEKERERELAGREVDGETDGARSRGELAEEAAEEIVAAASGSLTVPDEAPG